MKSVFFAAATAALAAVPASAVVVNIASYDISTNTANFLGDGLVVETTKIASEPLNLGDIAVGDAVSFELFAIYTDETVVNLDDQIPGDITFQMILNAPPGMGGVGGDVYATTFLGLFQEGVLDWDNAGEFSILYGVGGEIKVNLTDANFNGNSCFFCGKLEPGSLYGDIVTATVTHVSDGGPINLPVPAPGAIGLLGLGFLGLASARTRRA